MQQLPDVVSGLWVDGGQWPFGVVVKKWFKVHCMWY